MGSPHEGLPHLVGQHGLIQGSPHAWQEGEVVVVVIAVVAAAAAAAFHCGGAGGSISIPWARHDFGGYFGGGSGQW